MSEPVPFVDLSAAHAELAERLEDAALRVSRSGRYLFGPEVEAFEHEFARYCGTEHCVAVGSGLRAIELGLRAAGIGPGDEVIVPAYTFVATWLAVTATGARPVGVEVRRATYNIDPERIEAAIGDRTAAIVAVHLRGEPAEMAPIREIASSRGLFVLEDAAQAHGARMEGVRAGAIGDAAAFSFYPSKNLGAMGDGGAVTTDDAALAGRVRALASYGAGDPELEVPRSDSRLAELQAAILRVKLERLDEWNSRRASIASAYREALGGSEDVELPDPAPGAEPVWHLFVVGHSDRDRCRELLGQNGIGTGVHYSALPHLSDRYRDAGQPPGSFPVAERLAARTLSLPMYPQLDPDASARVASILSAPR